MIHSIIDCIGILGIALLALGLYQIAPLYMFIVIGTLFILFALCSESGTITIRRKKKG